MIPARATLDLRVPADAVPDRGQDLSFTAPDEALQPLAQAIGVDQVRSCQAALHLAPDSAGIAVTGSVRAAVVQTCGVSLEPFETIIDEPVDARFSPEAETAAIPHPPTDGDEEGSAGMADLPEPIVGGSMDLGRLIQEFLVLAVDPYPRKPGVEFEPPAAARETPSPFAALANLKSAGTSEE